MVPHLQGSGQFSDVDARKRTVATDEQEEKVLLRSNPFGSGVFLRETHEGAQGTAEVGEILIVPVAKLFLVLVRLLGLTLIRINHVTSSHQARFPDLQQA